MTLNELIAQVQESLDYSGIPDGSITLEKLGPDVTAKALGGLPSINQISEISTPEVLPDAPENCRLVFYDGIVDDSDVSVSVSDFISLTSRDFTVDKILGSEIDNKTITGANIAESTIGGINIQAATLTGDHLIDKTITNMQIASDAVKLSFTNTTVATSAFVSDTTYTDFPYRATVALPDVENTMVPEVVFSATDAMSGNFAPVSESYDGGIYIYASGVPDAEIMIPTILCWR